MRDANPLAPEATAGSIAGAVASGAVTARAVTAAALARVAERDPDLNAFTEVLADKALADAEAADARLARGEPARSLEGVPFAVKNLFDVAGSVTLAGSLINRDNAPALADAALVSRLKAAGAILVGMLNMDEYAYGFTTENHHYGPSRNPHDLARSAGGSSGGSSAAVAGGIVPISLGSDTNGSIRVPSSFTGLFGLKPTYGRLSRHGSFPFVYSIDHLGPFARSVSDLALAYDSLQGLDPADPAQSPTPPQATLDGLEESVAGLRVAVADGYFDAEHQAEAHAAVGLAAEILGVSARVTIPDAALGRAAAYVISCTEGANLHLANLRERPGDFDPAVRHRLLAGALVPASWYLQAQRFRAAYRTRALSIFEAVDIILAPATPVPAPLLGQPTIMVNGESLPTRPNIGIYTQPISAIGLPVVAVPMAAGGNLPIGIQVIAAPWAEASALRVARALERSGAAKSGVAPYPFNRSA